MAHTCADTSTHTETQTADTWDVFLYAPSCPAENELKKTVCVCVGVSAYVSECVNIYMSLFKVCFFRKIINDAVFN